MMITQHSIGNWHFNLSDTSRVMGSRLALQGSEMLRNWQDVFPHEDTWVRRQFGVPSLLVRLDCVEFGGDLKVYEVEERPSGVGMTREMNPDFRQRFDALRRKWPEFSVVVSSTREKRGDDHLWAKVIDLDQVNGEPVLVRAEPDETDYRHLSEKSISTLLTKGDKSYGLPLGWWTTVHWSDVQDDIEALPWASGFALKPVQGSKCRDVFVVPHKGFKCKQKASRPQVGEALRRHGSMYLQPFIPPMTWEMNGSRYYEIWRVFYGYDPETRDWIPLGGVWNARPNTLRLHGASDAIFGAVVIG